MNLRWTHITSLKMSMMLDEQKIEENLNPEIKKIEVTSYQGNI